MGKRERGGERREDGTKVKESKKWKWTGSARGERRREKRRERSSRKEESAVKYSKGESGG